jgi:hypothetical protein
MGLNRAGGGICITFQGTHLCDWLSTSLRIKWTVMLRVWDFFFFLLDRFCQNDMEITRQHDVVVDLPLAARIFSFL